MNRSHMHNTFNNIHSEGRRVYEVTPPGDGASAGGEKTPAAETVSKGEYDRLLGEMEGLRAEVITPEYLEFLQSKDKPKDPPKERVEGGEVAYGLTQPQIEAMSKTDLMKHISKFAQVEAAKEVNKVKEELSAGEKEKVRAEIKGFARTHQDFEKYRHAMHGMSLDPKFAEYTLPELYAKAKELYPSGPSKEEIEKVNKAKGERPGGDSESFEKYKKMSADEVAAEAMAETKTKLGIDAIPSA